MLRRGGHKEVSKWVILIVGIASFLIIVASLISGEMPTKNGTFNIDDDEPDFAAGLMFFSILSIGCFTAFWWMREKRNDFY